MANKVIDKRAIATKVGINLSPGDFFVDPAGELYMIIFSSHGRARAIHIITGRKESVSHWNVTPVDVEIDIVK